MILGPEDLVLCSGTLPGASFAERVAAAAAGGFSGISLFANDYERAKSDGLSDADMRAMLADQGLAIAELDPLLNWIPSAGLAADATEEGAAFFQATEAGLYAIADALGARSVNAVVVTDAPLTRPAIAEAFAALCDRAAGHGLLVHLEFLPWTQIPNVGAALEIVEMADRSNGGIMLDSWHHFRSGSDDARLRSVPGKRILAIQLNDAPEQAEDNLIDETLHRRLLPGEGAIDLVGLIRIVDELGSPAPIGVEIFSDSLAELPPVEIGRRAGEATRAILQRARSGR